ncbi:MAG: alpha/beta hydrolase [Pseudomonadota bacterium]|nr:alpha/beta hydrolase [Pseudomonadota bacterium]
MHELLQAWQGAGATLALPGSGLHVFYRDVGDRSAAPADTALLMHGFPESSFSFHKVLEGLQAHFQRVVLLDLIGYGLSDKPGETEYGYSLMEQADVALTVWQHLGLRGGHLIAHDMGDSVSTELVARSVAGLLPAGFDAGFLSVTLTNGSMVLSLAKLRVTQRLLLTRIGPSLTRLVNKKTFVQQVRSAHGADTLSDEDVDLMWAANCLQDGHHKSYLTIRYLFDRRRFEATRWLPALAATEIPVHLCWGEADAVARVEMAHYLKQKVCKSAVLSLMPGVGHFCQISDPDIWLRTVLGYYG